MPWQGVHQCVEYGQPEWNLDGYDAQGFHKDTGLDHEGYDRDGWNDDGFARDGVRRHDGQIRRGLPCADERSTYALHNNPQIARAADHDFGEDEEDDEDPVDDQYADEDGDGDEDGYEVEDTDGEYIEAGARFPSFTVSEESLRRTARSFGDNWDPAEDAENYMTESNIDENDFIMRGIDGDIFIVHPLGYHAVYTAYADWSHFSVRDFGEREDWMDTIENGFHTRLHLRGGDVHDNEASDTAHAGDSIEASPHQSSGRDDEGREWYQSSGWD